MQEKFQTVMLCLILLIVQYGCDAGSSNGKPAIVGGKVALSGVIGIGDTGATPPLFGLGRRMGSTPQNQVVVIAIDNLGNSIATATDRTGYFKFSQDQGIQPNTAYSLVFVDMASLEIMATLTAASGGVASLNLTGDTNLNEIIIDRSIKLAAILGFVSVGGERQKLDIATNSVLDVNGDGQITQAEILQALVNTTLIGNVDAINSVSAFTFLGRQDTWTISVDLEDEAWTANVCDWIDLDNPPPGYPSSCNDTDDENDPEIDFLTDSGEMTLIATDRVKSPEGILSDVAKTLELTYLNIPYPDPTSPFVSMIDTSLIWDVGFASGSQADINATASLWGSGPGINSQYWSAYVAKSLSPPPTTRYQQNMGLLGWSEYSFPAVSEGLLISGSKEIDDENGGFRLVWGNSTLPLNLPIGQEFILSETETNEYIDPITGAEVIDVEVSSSLVTVKLARNADGTPALLQEADGATGMVLPVFQLIYTDQLEDESECSYVVAHYGVEGDDADGDCDDSSDWLISLVNLRFGRISVEGTNLTVIDLTPLEIVANDIGEGLPVDANGNLTGAGIEWLKYVYNNTQRFEYQYEPLTPEDGDDWGSISSFWAWVEKPQEGSALKPQPGSASGKFTATLLKMGESPGTIWVNNVHYLSTDNGVQFYLDLRVADLDGVGEHSVLANPIAIDNSVDTSAAVQSDTVIDISATFPVLPAANEVDWGPLWLSLEDPDGFGEQTYQSGLLTVWIIMDADSDLETLPDQYRFPVDSYRVINPSSAI